jgi:hypothetical protein
VCSSRNEKNVQQMILGYGGDELLLTESRSPSRLKTTAITMIITALFMLLGISPVVSAGTPADRLTIDLVTELGAPTYRAAGFIYGLSQDGTQPSQSMQSDIRTQFIRAGGAQIGCPDGGWANGEYTARWNSVAGYYERTQAIGATFILLVHDLWGADAVCSVPFWPGDNDDWTAYTDFISQVIADAIANGMTGSDVQWDLWNEPDLGIFWGRSQSQYLDMWKRGYEMIRAAIPDAVIVGPSTAGQPSLGWFTTYLDHVNENDVIPDYLSWHQLVTYSDPQVSRAILDNLLSARSIIVQGYQVNEYGDCCNDEQQPGPSVWYLGRFERNHIDALRANWGMAGDLYAGMGGLVTSSGEPLGVWWAYKRYADISGQLVRVTAGSEIDGVAGVDSEMHQSIFVLGNRGVSGSVRVEINGFDNTPYLLEDGQTNVLVERLPSGSEAVAAPEIVFDELMAVEDNTLILMLDWSNPLDAYAVTLTPSVNEHG